MHELLDDLFPLTDCNWAEVTGLTLTLTLTLPLTLTLTLSLTLTLTLSLSLTLTLSLRRLDYTPCSCHAYPSLSKAPGAPEHHLIVGTHTGGLMIYADLELVWAARLPSPAMAVRVGTFAHTPGLLAASP